MADDADPVAGLTGPHLELAVEAKHAMKVLGHWAAPLESDEARDEFWADVRRLAEKHGRESLS